MDVMMELLLFLMTNIELFQLECIKRALLFLLELNFMVKKKEILFKREFLMDKIHLFLKNSKDLCTKQEKCTQENIFPKSILETKSSKTLLSLTFSIILVYFNLSLSNVPLEIWFLNILMIRSGTLWKQSLNLKNELQVQEEIFHSFSWQLSKGIIKVLQEKKDISEEFPKDRKV